MYRRGQVEMLTEQQIALALIEELQDRQDWPAELRFNDGKNVFVVKIDRTSTNSDVHKGLYVSLGPPGKTCRCCNGSGKRS